MIFDYQPSNERGAVEHNWLHTKHSFSFGDYYNPKRMGFGALRVLNDDIIEPGKGFGLHPHENMEIVTIVLKGALEHKDSLGSHGVIRTGEVQRMSAGSGVKHSEYNHSKEESVHLLQIWVTPKEFDIDPSYEQKSFPMNEQKNRLYPIVSNIKNSNTLFIHQDATFSLGSFDAGVQIEKQTLSPKRGIYFFLINGEMDISDKKLKSGDALSISGEGTAKIKAIKPSYLLAIEVPMME
jgi:redox-sensitive bicupin YhaK (pirin superfamily)